MNTFRNSTAIVAVLTALTAPMVQAQDTSATTEIEGGVEVTDPELLKKLKQEADEAAKAAEAAGQVEATDDSAAEAEADADVAVESDAEADVTVGDDTETAEEAEARKAALKAQRQAERKAARQAERKAAREAEQAAAKQAELEAAEAAAQAEADAAAEAEAEAEAATEAEATAETKAADPETDQTDTTQYTPATSDQDTADVTPDTAPAADTEADVATDADQQKTKKELAAERKAARLAEQAERRAQRQAERRAQRQAERDAAAAAAASNAEAAEVETEAVTEDTSRASDEEFEASAQPKDDDGLSKFEKALLIGLGAVAVGQLLNNGDEVVSNSGDRVVVRGEDGLRVLKSDNELLRRPGADVRTETFDDGSTRTTVTQPDGNRVVTIAAADGRVIQRFVVRPDGTEVTLIDDTVQAAPVEVSLLETQAPEPAEVNLSDEAALRAALQGQLLSDPGRAFSLAQVRGLRSVRELAPTIELDAVTFASGSAAIQPSQAEELVALGRAISDVIIDAPEAVFLIEGHTDAVGQDAYNLSLSDRRAETVALALTEYFDVPPENLITQGYGESALKIQTQAAERANRRAVVRNITSLLR